MDLQQELKTHDNASEGAKAIRGKHHSHTPAENRHTPINTYRLQLGPQFTFAQAEEIIPYLAQLGVSDIYLSPILQAAPGSTHGYDIVDHTQISQEMGGITAFCSFAEKVHAAKMHLVVDIVPNHMAVPTPLYLNHALWDVLRYGAESDYANWFDISLEAHGEGILMPILGERIGTVIANNDLQIVQQVVPGFEADGEVPVLKYHEHIFPIRPGTESLPISELVDRQFYRLAYWRVANDELNYRRFFDVDTLAAIRVEDPEVFNASHALLIKLFNDGLIDAFRIDHPDGLADPRGYLRQLHQVTGGAWVVAEKILADGEKLPNDWICAGTTGYDAMKMLQGLYTDPAGISELTNLYTEISQQIAGLSATENAAKQQIIDSTLFTEVNRLAQILERIFTNDVRLRDHTFRMIRESLVALTIQMDRYRVYVVPGERPNPEDERVLREAAERAIRKLDAELAETLEVILEILLGNEVGSAGRTHEELRHEAIVRFQQLCGPVMAKSVEDTTFYRYTPLLSANEVGSSPATPAVSTDEFYAWQTQMDAAWPLSLNSLSTHDTKRCEDVRARISALSEYSKEWSEAIENLRHELAPVRPIQLDGQIENLLYQTLLGTWTNTGPIAKQRLADYLRKAAREQKTWTTWTEVNNDLEEALISYANSAIDNEKSFALLEDFSHLIAESARTNILSMKALSFLLVGVTDNYQGQEITQNSLVDPDNRRAVDYQSLTQMLAQLDEHGLPSSPLSISKNSGLLRGQCGSGKSIPNCAQHKQVSAHCQSLPDTRSALPGRSTTHPYSLDFSPG
ncbi:malto-oligosyltrehalose synthase [Arcanobacterium hippocoleae]|uniref:malto-oligosyltrehalose synthase n=1 Tax=Arcanobacterium hippocoleae TaxID=149017 RepID=UPI00334254D7